MTFRHFRKIQIHVIPAKAGIHSDFRDDTLDPGFRRDGEQHACHPGPLFDIEIDP